MANNTLSCKEDLIFSDTEDESLEEESSFHSEEIWENPLSTVASNVSTSGDYEEEEEEEQEEEQEEEEVTKAHHQANRRASSYIGTRSKDKAPPEDILGYLFQLMEEEEPKQIAQQREMRKQKTQQDIFTCLRCVQPICNDNIVEFLPCKHVYCIECIIATKCSSRRVLCLDVSCSSTCLATELQQIYPDTFIIHQPSPLLVELSETSTSDKEPLNTKTDSVRVPTNPKGHSKTSLPLIPPQEKSEGHNHDQPQANTKSEKQIDINEESSTEVDCPECNSAFPVVIGDLVECPCCNYHFCSICRQEIETAYHICLNEVNRNRTQNEVPEGAKKAKKRRHPIITVITLPYRTVRKWCT